MLQVICCELFAIPISNGIAVLSSYIFVALARMVELLFLTISTTSYNASSMPIYSLAFSLRLLRNLHQPMCATPLCFLLDKIIAG